MHVFFLHPTPNLVFLIPAVLPISFIFFFFSKSTSCCTCLLVYFEDFLLPCKLCRCTMIVICMRLQMKHFEVHALVCLFTIFHVFVCKYCKYRFNSWSVVSSYIVRKLKAYKIHEFVQICEMLFGNDFVDVCVRVC